MTLSHLTSADFTAEDWQSWRWQMANAIDTAEALQRWIDVSPDEERAIKETASSYKWRVTPYYASLMDKHDPSCAIRRQALPDCAEMRWAEGLSIDPNGDRRDRKTNRVIHRYADHALLLVTQTCPVYCRHCTRKYHTTHRDGTYFGAGEGVSFDEDLAYLAAHTEIREVLLSGGDPLTYSDAKLETLLKGLRAIPHIEIIRIGSRYPVLLPQRITDEFCAMLVRYHPIWFSTHFNHPRELSPEAIAACDRLSRHGVPIVNSTVLLKGINDDSPTMESLLRGLVNARVKPYYLFHCDNVQGTGHFMTTVEAGQKLVAGLVGKISGYAIPRYAITTDHSKIPLEKSYLAAKDGALWLEDRDGTIQKLSERLYGAKTINLDSETVPSLMDSSDAA